VSGLLAAAASLSLSATPLFVPPEIVALPPSPDAVTLATRADFVERMTVAVFINGKGPFQFVVDTGANRTVLSSALATRLMLPPGQRVQLHDIAGVGGADTALIGRLRVGNRDIENIVAPLLLAENMGADGILGIDGLARQMVDFDFPRARMTITPIRMKMRDEDMIVVRARRRFGQLILADARIRGERIYVIIDSGAQYTVGNSALRDRLMRNRRNPRTEPVTLIGVTGNTMTADYAVTPEMQIGGVTVRNLPIAFSDVHPFRQFGLSDRPAMLLGMDVLRGFARVSLDFEEKKVSFQLRREE
jgi:predicted aspartyl protease